MTPPRFGLSCSVRVRRLDCLGALRASRGAFTLVELLVVLGIIALVISLLLPSLCRSRETANRIKCASNLRQIGQALLLYANENNGHGPRTTYVPGAPPTFGTGAAASNPFAPDGPSPNDVAAAVFLLLRTQDITSEVFVCPSSNHERWDFGGGSNTAANWSNFAAQDRNLSYSFHNPYPDTPELDKKLTFNVMDKDFAIAADKNPGQSTATYARVLDVTSSSSAREMKGGNSSNHDQDGQNVLYADGHANFEQNPFVGVNRDNIFTARKADGSLAVLAPPFDAIDSILLPAAQ